MSMVLNSETRIIYALNLDRAHELDEAIVLEDQVEDLGFKPNLCIHAFCESYRPLASTLNDVEHVCNSYDLAQSFDKLSRAIISILVVHFLQNMLLVANDFNFFGIVQVHVISCFRL